MGGKILLVLAMIVPANLFAAKTGEVDYSRSITASEASEWFFGKSTPPQQRMKLALNVGRISIRLGTKLKCGNLSLTGNLSAELQNLQKQLSEATKDLEGMITNGGAAVAAICYFKPNVCAHMRHFSAMLQEELNIQMDACRAVDNFINDQASKGQKELQAKAVENCVNSNSKLGPSEMKKCLDAEGTARNLLRPFNNRVANGKQKVLSSILRVVNESEDYEVWSQLLGEVDLHKNGYWSKAFPKDLLKPSDYVDNVMIASEKLTCDPARLRTIIESSATPSGSTFDKYVNEVLAEKISLTTIFNLESLPAGDRRMACQALGNSVAALAIKRFNAKGQSNLTAALANDALPDQLSEFYANRSEMTFSAIDAKLASDEIKPLGSVIAHIGKLGSTYRKKGREEAADITANKLQNKNLENQCTDSFSCED